MLLRGFDRDVVSSIQNFMTSNGTIIKEVCIYSYVDTMYVLYVCMYVCMLSPGCVTQVHPKATEWKAARYLRRQPYRHSGGVRHRPSWLGRGACGQPVLFCALTTQTYIHTVHTY